QKLRRVWPVGTVKVWLIELSPFVGLVPPTRAEYVPECAPPLTTAAVPTVVQPVKLPVSNPPLVMPPLEGAVTPRVTAAVCVVEWVAEAPVPVTVMVYVPGAAVPAPTVSVELPPDWIGLVPKVQPAPVGHPLAERVIDCGLPEVTVVEIVLSPEAPWFTVRLFGLAEMEKSFGGGGPFTVSATVVECVFEAPAPVTATV